MRGLLLSVFFFASVVRAQPQPDPVVVAAQEREAKMQRLAVAFTTDETHFVNAKNGVREVPLHGSFGLKLVDTKERYDADRQVRDVLTGQVRRLCTAIVDNTLQTREWTRMDEQPETMTISAAQMHRPLGDGEHLPLTLFARGLLGETFGYDWRQAKPTGQQATINDLACVEYQLVQKNRTANLWVAPSRRHTLQRLEVRHGAKLSRTFDVTYVADEPLGWRPQGWTRTDWNDQHQRRVTATTTITDWQCPAALLRDTFTFEFPDNIRVRDERTGEEYLMVGGLAQPLPEPVNTNPPEPVRLRREWLYGIIAACLTLVVVAVFWLRRQRRA